MDEHAEALHDAQRFRNDVALLEGLHRHRIENADEQLRVRIRPHLHPVEGREGLVGPPGRHGTIQREGDDTALFRWEVREGAQRALHRSVGEVVDDRARGIEQGLQCLDLDLAAEAMRRIPSAAGMVSMAREATVPTESTVAVASSGQPVRIPRNGPLVVRGSGPRESAAHRR